MSRPICKHLQWIINQGVHWCGKQLPIYPDCKDCPFYEPDDTGYIYTTGGPSTTLKIDEKEVKDE